MLAIVLASLAAVLDLVATALGWEAVRPVTKLLPALIMAASFWGTDLRRSGWFVAGLLCAAVGDAWLLGSSESAFMCGMLAFAAMHVWYIAGFRRIPGQASKLHPAVIAAMVLAIVCVNAALYPHTGTFAVPLAVYSVLLGLMVLSSIDFAVRVPRRAAAAAACGGAIFMFSDTTLAFAKFWPSFALSPELAVLTIDATYFAAQILIASGVRETIAARRATSS